MAAFRYSFIPLALILLLSSCNTLQQASTHGFHSGYYHLQSSGASEQMVYLDVSEDSVVVYQHEQGKLEVGKYFSIPLQPCANCMSEPMSFRKQSLDIDMTSVLMKYRPAVGGMQPQLNTDLNFALYAGWRFDHYRISSEPDPLGLYHNSISARGFDFGLFAGPGTTLISPFTTQNIFPDEYMGMTMQVGVAGFLESDFASFGIALGYDYLLGPDRNVWIYTNKPWIGFIVGVALN